MSFLYKPRKNKNAFGDMVKTQVEESFGKIQETNIKRQTLLATTSFFSLCKANTE